MRTRARPAAIKTGYSMTIRLVRCPPFPPTLPHLHVQPGPPPHLGAAPPPAIIIGAHMGGIMTGIGMGTAHIMG